MYVKNYGNSYLNDFSASCGIEWYHSVQLVYYMVWRVQNDSIYTPGPLFVRTGRLGLHEALSLFKGSPNFMASLQECSWDPYMEIHGFKSNVQETLRGSCWSRLDQAGVALFLLYLIGQRRYRTCLRLTLSVRKYQRISRHLPIPTNIYKY